MKTYDLDLELCPLCGNELELKEIKDMPEFKYICSKGHFEQMVAFWGCYFTIEDKGFSVPSLHNEEQVNEVNEYLMSIPGANTIK